MKVETLYKSYDPEYNTSEALGEVLRQTERHLEEQQRLTSAADQRAVAFAAVLIVVIGILLGNSTTSNVSETRVVVVFFLLISVSLAIYSARPTRIFGSGGTAASLVNYIGNRHEGYLISTLIERNDRNILHNDRVLKRSAWTFRISLVCAILSAAILIGDWADLCEYLDEKYGATP